MTQLSSDFFDLLTFFNPIYGGSGSKSGSREHSGSGFTILRVTLVLILGGEELVGEVQLSSDFFDLLTIIISFMSDPDPECIPVPQHCV